MVVPKPTGKDGKPFKPKEIKPKKKRGGGMLKKFPKKPSPVRRIGTATGKAKDPSGLRRKDFKGPKPAGKAGGGVIDTTKFTYV